MGTKMADPAEREATFTHLVEQLVERHPDLAYLHLIEPRVAAGEDVEAGQGESLDCLKEIWGARPLLLAGGFKPAEAEADLAKPGRENTVLVYGRYFISNVSLAACSALLLE
jgi:NADPH2 dehydrogenase